MQKNRNLDNFLTAAVNENCKLTQNPLIELPMRRLL